MHTNHSAHEQLARKFARLSAADLEALRQLPLRVKKFRAREEIVRDGAHPSECCFVVKGMLHRFKLLPNGTASTLSYHFPGEIPDLQSLFLSTMDHSLGTIVASEVAFIPHSSVRNLVAARPELGFTLWHETLVDAARFRVWIVNVGARPARGRIAYLLCELFARLTAIELAETDGFILPLSQADIAEATGLSAVHVNRSMQDLRAEKLIVTEGKFLRILDWPRLKHVGGFEDVCQ